MLRSIFELTNVRTSRKVLRQFLAGIVVAICACTIVCPQWFATAQCQTRKGSDLPIQLVNSLCMAKGSSDLVRYRLQPWFLLEHVLLLLLPKILFPNRPIYNLVALLAQIPLIAFNNGLGVVYLPFYYQSTSKNIFPITSICTLNELPAFYGGNESEEALCVLSSNDYLASLYFYLFALFIILPIYLIIEYFAPSVATVFEDSEDSEERSGGYNVPSKEEQDLMKDFEKKLLQSRPKERFEDIAGQDKVKKMLKEAVILPAEEPELYESSVHLRPPKAILLYGPPGTGKTMLAMALAGEINHDALILSASDLITKWQGESERLVKCLFRVAISRPNGCLIFIDEIESIGSRREESDSDSARRIKSELLVQLTQVEQKQHRVFLLAATNMPWALDTALIRRMNDQVEVPIPDLAARTKILKDILKSVPNELDESDFADFAVKCEGFSGSDVAELARSVLRVVPRMVYLARYFKKVSMIIMIN